jgi:hypothetical protein
MFGFHIDEWMRLEEKIACADTSTLLRELRTAALRDDPGGLYAAEDRITWDDYEYELRIALFERNARLIAPN